MSDSNPTTLLLAVPGPEQYAAVPKSVVRNAIKQGQIRQSQLIWSPVHNDWMQVRDLPHLSQDTQQLQPAPVQTQPVTEPTQTERLPEPPRTQSLPTPNPANRPILNTIKAPSAPLPKPKAKAATNPTPVAQARPAMAANSVAVPSSSLINKKSKLVVKDEEDEGIPVLKILTITLFFSILGLLGSNYVLVTMPLSNSLAQTPFSQVPVYAHLVGFYQQDALAIHVFPSSNLTADKFLDFLTTLAQSTPRTALKGDLFETIGLAPGYSVKFVIRGQDWNQFSLMTQASETDRKTFLLQHITDNDGNFLLPVSGGMMDTATDSTDDKVDKAWQTLVKGLTSP